MSKMTRHVYRITGETLMRYTLDIETNLAHDHIWMVAWCDENGNAGAIGVRNRRTSRRMRQRSSATTFYTLTCP